ncbi:a81253be-1f2d-467c-a668-21aafa556a8b [Sclerotinia trifoliorum]|uniref:A81253be-1f2d-467c-a668-21aafa556a8b n=1 Tax=Sclerotinia trifoliorum TaxID=28548 RepID=A0A8H2VR48_9HELO|nr:a81253be-1f2d-467c-a668-21aafa556a8b [Sclerotinia trifoliorum]
MKTAKFIILWGLGMVAWAAPTVGSGLTKRGDSGSSVAAVMMSHGKEVDDDDVIYTDYRRAARPEESDDGDVIYTDYKRETDDKDDIYTDYKRETDDKDDIYTDYKRAAQPKEEDDKDDIYTDY